MRTTWCVVALMVLSGAAAAQEPGRMGGRGGFRGRAEAPGFDPLALEGAPDPEFMAGRLELSDEQAARYRQLRDSFMLATKPQRDSADGALQAIRDAFRSGDREAARQNGAALRHLAGDLSKRQEQFEQALKALVSSDQWKAYTEWRDEHRHELELERRSG